MATKTYLPAGASIPNDTGGPATTSTKTYLPAGASIPDDVVNLNVIYWYRWDLEVDAQSCLDYINGLAVFPITGNREGEPAPDNQKTIDWKTLFLACTDGKFGFPAITDDWFTKLEITQEDIDPYSPTIEPFNPAWIP